MYTEFHKELKRRKIEISFNNGKLKYSGPKENIDEDFIRKLRKYKPDLIKDYWPKDCFHIMPLNTNGNKTPLILLHIGNFEDTAKTIDNDRPVYGMYHLGSQGETIEYKTVEDFADEYLKQLLKIIPNGPFYLGGMSFGGIIAYEIAIRLIEMGYKVPMLIIGDTALATLNKKERYNWITNGGIFQMGYNVLRRTKHYLVFYYKKIKLKLFPSIYYKMSFWERTQYVIFKYEQIAKKYTPKFSFNNKVLLFKSTQIQLPTKCLGWEKICNDISVVSFNGDHMSMFYDSKNANFIKTNIQDWITKVEETEVIHEPIPIPEQEPIPEY